MADLTLNEYFGNGLRPKRDMARDPRYCREMKNMIPLGPRGARPLRQVTYPLDSPSLSVSFPFPQILRDEDTILYFGSASTVSEVGYTSAYPWTATALSVYSGVESVTNGRFDEDASWTKGTGWTISGGTANATTASATLAQAGILTAPSTYRIKYTITRSAGTITPTFGTTAGTTRSTSGTFTEEVVADATGFSFVTSGFTGTVDNVSIRELVTPGGTGPFRLVSFSDVWFASNGTRMLYRIPGNLDTNDTPYVHTVADWSVQAVGKHNNTLVLGGMAGTRITSNAYTLALFNHWKSVQKQNQTITKHHVLNSEYIMYSEPGGAENDLPFQVFLAALGLPGAYEADFFQGIVYSRVENGEIGFFRTRECGPIMHLKQLGNNLVAYGEYGVSLLMRDENGYQEQPISTVGLKYREAVAGDDQEHMFVNSRYELMRLTAGGGLERLDYSEHLENLSSTTVATFDQQRRYYWFSTSTRSYCWTGFGLGESRAVRPMSLFRMEDNSGLLGTASTDNDPQEAQIVGPIIRQPNGQTMEITSIDVMTVEADATSWTATADWNMRNSDQFRRPGFIDVTDRGRAFVKKTGVNFRPVLKAANYKEVDCDGISLNIGQGKPSVNNIMAATDTILSETNV